LTAIEDDDRDVLLEDFMAENERDEELCELFVTLIDSELFVADTEIDEEL